VIPFIDDSQTPVHFIERETRTLVWGYVTMYRLSIVPFASFALVVAACDVSPEESTSNSEWVVSSFPENGDYDVSRIGTMAIKLDRRVYPNTVDRGSVQISSGAIFSWLNAYFEPVTKQIVIGLHPDRPLEPFATYRLIVQGLVDLDGVTQPELYQLLFRTGSRLDETIPSRTAEWSKIEAILKRSCAQTNCHAGSNPVMGLDLSTLLGVQQTAIGAPSNQLPKNTISAEGASGLLSFSAFPIIDVSVSFGQPAGSYLMYKVLGDSHIVGHSMPPPDSSFPKLEREELEALSLWIRFGAITQPAAP